MAWAVPQFTKSHVDRAGKALVTPGIDQAALEDALLVINNWRGSHSFPLNTMQVSLRRIARQVDKGALVAQRIKRLSSITLKLERFKTMKLSQMQDIGGCRAVVSSVARVEMIAGMYRGGELRHRHHFVRMDDYIQHPQKTGYRGVHFIYRYQSDRKHTYNGLQIEIQVRSQLQHAWATAVETVSTFLDQALKSSQGSDRWLRFFSLMGTAIALREKRPLVPDTPSDPQELRRELRAITNELQVTTKLKGFGDALQTLPNAQLLNASYYLLTLDPGGQWGITLAIQPYTKAQLDTATTDYLRVERAMAERPGAEAVLVSVDSLGALRRAYPNYFLDTKVFLEAVEEAIA